MQKNQGANSLAAAGRDLEPMGHVGLRGERDTAKLTSNVRRAALHAALQCPLDHMGSKVPNTSRPLSRSDLLDNIGNISNSCLDPMFAG